MFQEKHYLLTYQNLSRMHRMSRQSVIEQIIHGILHVIEKIDTVTLLLSTNTVQTQTVICQTVPFCFVLLLQFHWHDRRITCVITFRDVFNSRRP